MSLSSRYEIPQSAFDAPLDERVAFLRRTYLHLAGAVLAFVALSALFQISGIGLLLAQLMVGGGRLGWLAVIGGFTLVGWMATAMAQSSRSLGTQYAGLALYTVAEAIIFAPLLFFASRMPGVLPTAAGLTILTFCGLSIYVLTTRKDFSFLGAGLMVAGLVALGIIIAGAIFGFSLGIWFSGAMILLAMGAILYSTSNALHNYGTDQYVAAALELFAAVALLFWYVLRLLMQLNRR